MIRPSARTDNPGRGGQVPTDRCWRGSSPSAVRARNSSARLALRGCMNAGGTGVAPGLGAAERLGAPLLVTGDRDVPAPHEVEQHGGVHDHPDRGRRIAAGETGHGDEHVVHALHAVALEGDRQRGEQEPVVAEPLEVLGGERPVAVWASAPRATSAAYRSAAATIAWPAAVSARGPARSSASRSQMPSSVPAVASVRAVMVVSPGEQGSGVGRRGAPPGDASGAAAVGRARQRPRG